MPKDWPVGIWYSTNDIPQSISKGDEKEAEKFLDVVAKFSSMADEFVPKDKLPGEVLEQILMRRQNMLLINRLTSRKPAKSALSQILAAAFNKADCEAEKLTRSGEMDEEAATFHRTLLQFRKSLLDVSQRPGSSLWETFYESISSLPPQELEWLSKYLDKKPVQRERKRVKNQTRKPEKKAKTVTNIDQDEF